MLGSEMYVILLFFFFELKLKHEMVNLVDVLALISQSSCSASSSSKSSFSSIRTLLFCQFEAVSLSTTYGSSQPNESRIDGRLISLAPAPLLLLTLHFFFCFPYLFLKLSNSCYYVNESIFFESYLKSRFKKI